MENNQRELNGTHNRINVSPCWTDSFSITGLISSLFVPSERWTHVQRSKDIYAELNIISVNV